MKEKLKELLNPGANSSDFDLSSYERGELRHYLRKYGMTDGRIYNRCFRSGKGSGFEPFEIEGIASLVKQFEARHGLIPTALEDLPFFYDRLYLLKTDFCTFMGQHGMGKNACIYRFSNWNFQEWEVRGIRSILGDLN